MILLFVFSFVIGLIMGSFLNCLIYRLYHKKSILGRSFCPRCSKKISWYDNVPVLSFFLLRRRCRSCRQKISWQYPLVELATGFLFLAAAYHQLASGSSDVVIYLLRDWLMIFALIFTFVYDLKFYIIEDTVLMPIAAVILFINLFLLKIYWLNIVLAGLGAGLFFIVQYLITRGKGIGLGDFRIGILLGVYFGWPNILAAILASYLIGSLIGLALILTRQKKWASQVPLGPFLVIGSLVTMFFGQKIIGWYLHTFL
ncbi:MAG: prepilin peptidase [Patescibacteria group bacterium]|nr:prepilin peptidase [Patescibacteria group bacterium]MDD5121343.1 prepilin peptidase [Patescibacteria group bacterium]MDD5222299.1 prepilin peptidase [Patescibacteria group bacterium]MDD5395738.1 prepilin peptidase [Patescibacteria group bacterium]